MLPDSRIYVPRSRHVGIGVRYTMTISAAEIFYNLPHRVTLFRSIGYVQSIDDGCSKRNRPHFRLISVAKALVFMDLKFLSFSHWIATEMVGVLSFLSPNFPCWNFIFSLSNERFFAMLRHTFCIETHDRQTMRLEVVYRSCPLLALFVSL